MSQLQCDCSSGDAYLEKTFGSPAAPTWYVQLQVMFPSSTITALTADEFTATILRIKPADGNVDSVFGTGDDTSGGSHDFVSGNKNWLTNETPGFLAVTGWATDTFYTVLYAYDGTTVTVSIDGSPLFSYSLAFGSPDLDTFDVGGSQSNSRSGEVYYIADVRVGTTPGGTEIFADDFSGDLSAWTVIGDATIVSGGPSGPTNVTQAAATALVGDCSEGTISNAGATDTLAASDPLNTVYSLGGTFSRQVWWKLTNTTGSQAYARFILKNTSGGPIDIAAAIYVDDPATVPIDPNRSVNFVESWQIPLSPGGTITLGTALADSGTVWLEIGGDDTEGDGDGWNGNLDLTWELLGATFKDTPDAGMEGTTEYRGDLQGATRDGGIPIPTSYCKCGDLHFAAINQAAGVDIGHTFDTDLRVWVWSDSGGAATDYNITSDFTGNPGLRSNSQVPTGTGVPLLRTDGTNVWLIAYELFAGTIIHCNGVDHLTGTTLSPSVLVWNGSGFTYLGSDSSQTFPWDHDTSGIKYGQLVGQVTAAASSEEVGVLHVMWSEAGPKTINPADCSITAFQERIGYSQWSTSGATVTAANAISASGPDTTLTPLVSQYLFATNAFGDLKAFYGPPNFTNLVDGHLQVTYGTVVEMLSIDESTGAATLLQSIDGATLNPAVLHLDEGGGSTIGGTRLQPQQPYGGVDTIFFVAPYPLGGSYFAPLLSVPADGSAAITQVTASVAGVSGISPGGSIQDAYDDGRNIWVGTGSIQVAGNAIVSGSLTCTTGTSRYTSDGGADRFVTPGGIELQYDDTGDGLFYTLGMNASIRSSTTEYAPLKIPILRDYLTCSIGICVLADGLHVWQRF